MNIFDKELNHYLVQVYILNKAACRIKYVAVKCKYILYFCGASTQFRAMTYPYVASRSHSGQPHSVGLLWTSDQPDAETAT